MRGEGDSRRPIDAAAKAGFVAALRFGAPMAAAAAWAGFSPEGFYGARRRDTAFDSACREALELSAREERGLGAGGAALRQAQDERDEETCPHCGEALRLVQPNNRRKLQKRRVRQLRFTDARKAAFLAAFATDCDAERAAAEVGVDRSTVFKHRRLDPVFADGFDQALDQGYAALDAEAIRQRVAAQRRLQAALEAGAVPAGELEAEFERVLKLLRRWDRRGARPGVRHAEGGPRGPSSLDEAVAALERKLKALGIPVRDVPPEADEE